MFKERLCCRNICHARHHLLGLFVPKTDLPEITYLLIQSHMYLCFFTAALCTPGYASHLKSSVSQLTSSRKILGIVPCSIFFLNFPLCQCASVYQEALDKI